MLQRPSHLLGSMFSNQDKPQPSIKPARKPEKIYHAGQLLPILPAAELLAGNRHQFFLSQLRELFAYVPVNHYQALYTQLIENFAEFVQLLPTNVGGALGSLMNEALTRSLNVQHHFVGAYNISKTHLQGDDGHDLLLKNYAVFSASLLIDLCKLAVNHRILLTQPNGDFIEQWSPYLGSMLNKAEHYRLHPAASVNQRLQKLVGPLLAWQVLPEIAIDFLASDPAIFSDWLKVMQGDDDEGGAVGSILSLYRLDEKDTVGMTLSDVPTEGTYAPGTELGGELAAWIKAALASGLIAVNSAEGGAHAVSGGLLITHDALMQFAEKYGHSLNVVLNAMSNYFGIPRLSDYDFAHAKFFSDYPGIGSKAGVVNSMASSQQRQLITGVVVSQAALGTNFDMSSYVKAASSLGAALPSLHQAHQARVEQNLSTRGK